MFDKEETLKVLLKGTNDNDRDLIISKIEEAYKENRPLRIKFGLDPSAPDIHLGHAVALRKIKQLQDLGHTAVIIIGGFTGSIGDPSGKSKTRNQLSKEQVEENAQTYLDQLFKIVDREKAELHNNNDWFEKFSFRDVIQLAQNSTIARMMERDDFANRYANGKPIGIHELFYPLMQAYDSVQVKADIELGGTDQTFNVMMGRNLQKSYGQSQQVPLFVPLLVGTDGKEKMSKSLGNYIGVNEDARTMFAKIMQIPDDMIITYFELASDVSVDNIETIKKALASGQVNPMQLKLKLASDITRLYHTEEELKDAQRNFAVVYQGAEDESVDLPVLKYATDKLEEDGTCSLIELLYTSGKYKSKSEIRRLIQQGGVKVNGEKYSELSIVPSDDLIIQAGKGKKFKLAEQGYQKSLTQKQAPENR